MYAPLPERQFTKLLRTSATRLTLLYAGVFSVSVLLLLGAVAWLATGFITRQIDLQAYEELAELRRDAGGGGTPGLARLIGGLVAHPEGMNYLLQDAKGARIAGDLPTMPPGAGRGVLELPGGGARGRGVRGTGVVLPDGAYLFVGTSDLELRKMREALANAILPGLALTLLMAAAGGLATSVSVLRRVDGIGRASRAIMDGDLGRRLPVRGSGDEFDSLATVLNTMLDRIQELMRDLQQGADNIAHDLRTPLSRLRQRLELALRSDGSAADMVATLQASVADVDAILHKFSALLRIAQVEAGSRRAGFAPVELSLLLTGLAETYEPVAEGAGKRIILRAAPGIFVNGDRELLTQLFVNLVENAIRHSEFGTKIRVALRRDGAGSVAEIADDGVGIAPELRDRVQQRFFRGEASRTTQGSGLGLTMAAAVAGLHGTRIELKPGKPGLRCIIRFQADGVA